MIVAYKQKSSEQPRNPHRVWCGIVTTSIHIQGNMYIYGIQSVEEGYEGLEEYVSTDQIVSYEVSSTQSTSKAGVLGFCRV